MGAEQGFSTARCPKEIQLSIVFWGQNGRETHTKPQVQWFGSKIPRPTGQHIKNRIELHERALVQRTTSSKEYRIGMDAIQGEGCT